MNNKANDAYKVLKSISTNHSGYSISAVFGKYAGWWLHIGRTKSGPVFSICLGWFSFAVWDQDIEYDILRPLCEFAFKMAETVIRE